ncbi:hypothetical protein K461DRAFT_279375 [Myriangium duriaei CBS 260.36]|uniref:C2H2-type domain-containing protein n=1 Tax=Myriangium duriaei CBS 260.36 TaxID=1168546 RepID=A0A9P4J3T3_9PEZI|nr:hypothetical protein K461DRAFT_279375 [Myriangium duriaei CBS 260.36]
MAAVMQTPTPAPTGTSHPFTCNTCQVAFRSSDLQRTHMQSDWHRYNLKRRVASLPPLTSEIFAEKVLANKASAAATAARASFEKVCPACSKTYYSENAYQNHLGSQKHKAQVARMRAHEAMRDDAETGSMMSSTFSLGEPLETASNVSAADTTDLPTVTQGVRSVQLEDGVSATAPDSANAESESAAPSSSTTTNGATEESEEGLVEVRLNQCLFCNAASEDIDENLKHMSKQHGMFIPERDYLVDLQGLFTHLHEIVYDLHQCLYCRHTKHTISGIQTHMRDRGHCMIPYSTEEEMLDIGEYYDFRSTYSDEESEDDEDESAGGVKLGAARASKTVIETEDGEDEMLVDDEEGWESDASSLSSVPTDEITAMPIDDHSHRYKTLSRHHHHSHADNRPHRNFDGYHSHAHSTPRAVYHDDNELHLPSGRVAGHRSLNKYYRQNLRNRDEWAEPSARRAIEAARSDSEEEASEDESGRAQDSRQRDRGRQIISRNTRENAIAGVSDAKKRELKAAEKRVQQKDYRARMKYEWGNNKRANSQKHFRDPLLQ